jgi:hypothetical protein
LLIGQRGTSLVKPLEQPSLVFDIGDTGQLS